MRVRDLRQRQNVGDLHLDLAAGGCLKARGQIALARAWRALDHDAMIVEVEKIDHDIGAAMGARRHQPPVHANALERLRQNIGVGDVVVENVDALAAGRLNDFGQNILT